MAGKIISAQLSDETCLLFCYMLCFVIALFIALMWKWCNEGAFRGVFRQVGALMALFKNNWKETACLTFELTVALAIVNTGYVLFLQKLNLI